ncbi:MAG: histidine kinase [Actinomycetes bacterium]|jgi:signal transduction histidine kinase|nr:MAG: hypothetical protein DIU60_24410 [Actinomycetota bacterium]
MSRVLVAARAVRRGALLLADAALALIVFVLTADQGGGGMPEFGAFGGIGRPAQTVVAAAVAAPVLIRRLTPYPLLIAGAAAWLVMTAPWGLAVAAYTVSAGLATAGPEAEAAAHRRTRWTAAFAGALALLVFGRLLAERVSAGYALLLTVLVAGTPVLLGLWAGARRTLVATLRERAERLEREQAALAEQARAQERARIAREMHDVVAHRVSLMVVHAGALESTLTDEAAARMAGTIREIGREALTELRQVLRVLREEGQTAAVEPQPGVDALDRLVRRSREAGLPVTLETEGERRELPAATGRAVFRLVQEALTNVHKHAPGAATTVRLRYAADELQVTVRNAAPEHPPDTLLGRTGSGHGHHGLRERIRLLGGTFTAGPHPDGGYEVHATLPYG